MAPTVKVTYFDFHGYGETIKYILAYNNTPFQDIRMSNEEFSKNKTVQPYGRLPVLEIEGKRLHQSRSIARYLGNKAGIGGKDDNENLQIDISVDTVADLLTTLEMWYFMKDEKLKARETQRVKFEVSLFTKRFNKQIKENGGYLANGKLSWADLYFVAVLGSIDRMTPLKYREESTYINSLEKVVTSIPQIKKYIENRKPYDEELYESVQSKL